LIFFANFACFAALREPGLSVHGLIRGFSCPRAVKAAMSVPHQSEAAAHFLLDKAKPL
jgi:hypothetical protein